MTGRFEVQLREAEPEFRRLIGRIPLMATPPLPPDWLRCEMLERHQVLRRAPIRASMMVVEVGSGPHAISTVPLAFAAGPRGRVVAIESSRWGYFRTVVAESGMGNRIRPVGGDARRMPLGDDSAELAVCVHGLRSLRGDAEIDRVLREMFRISPRIFLAESLPIGRTAAQRAHLAMYELRERVFSATGRGRDDLKYRTLERIVSIVTRSGGVVNRAEVIEVDLPHYLAYFPRTQVEAISAGDLRRDLIPRWDEAHARIRRYGEDHPPVGIVTASRPSASERPRK